MLRFRFKEKLKHNHILRTQKSKFQYIWSHVKQDPTAEKINEKKNSGSVVFLKRELIVKPQFNINGEKTNGGTKKNSKWLHRNKIKRGNERKLNQKGRIQVGRTKEVPVNQIGFVIQYMIYLDTVHIKHLTKYPITY